MIPVPRENGWLKADALKTAGVSEQWAKEDAEARHEVTLSHDERQGGYVVQHVTLFFETSIREVHAWQVGHRLTHARSKFRSIVKSLGGRA